jgi:heparan-alpha-glucosaminide N-acetyltransferase
MELFGYELIYHHPTCLEMYQCQAYDPEGLLGVLSACSLTYLGLMAGRVLVHFKEHRGRLTRWLVWSCVLLLISGCLCGFSKNEGAIPINKNLWSTSFVFVTSGFGLLGLSLCYILIDVLNVWSGQPFIYLGMNSILIYVGHSLLGSYMPFSYMIYDINHATVLTMNVIGVCCWIALSYYCYTIKFFVKI